MSRDSSATDQLTLTSDVGAYADDLLQLQAAAAAPYSRFVYNDEAQANAAAAHLYTRGVAEFSPPTATLLLRAGIVLGVIVALDRALLTKRRIGSAMELTRAGLFTEHPDVARRARLAGTTLLRPEDGDWYLSRLATASNARGLGYGQLLLSHFLAEGRRRGLTRAVLEVDAASAPACRFYEAAGFQQIAEHHVTDTESGRSLRYRHMAVQL